MKRITIDCAWILIIPLLTACAASDPPGGAAADRPGGAATKAAPTMLAPFGRGGPSQVSPHGRLDVGDARRINLAFTPDGTALAYNSEIDGKIHLVSTADPTRELGALDGSFERVHALAVSPDGAWLAATGSSSTGGAVLQIWDLRLAAVKAQLTDVYFQDLAFSPDSSRLIAAGGRDLVVYAVPDLKSVFSDPDGLGAAAFSPNGSSVAYVSGTSSPVITVYDLASQRVERSLTLPNTFTTVTIASLAFSPAGDRLAAAEVEGPALIWDLEKGGDPLVILPPDSGPCYVAFNPDGSSLVTLGSGVFIATPRPGGAAGFRQEPDRMTVRIWNAADGTEIGAFRNAWVTALAFSRDWRSAATADGRYVYTWEVR